MKKIVLAGLVALSAMALSQQQASAWVNAKFGVGLNWQLQSGGNNFGWGFFRNGQVPGPEAFGGFSGGDGFLAPLAPPPPSHHHSYYGALQPSYDAPAPVYANQMAAPMQQSASPYQFATYPRQVYYYYPTPSYYYSR